MAEVMKRDDEISTMHQELNNFAALKKANKKYAHDLALAVASATVSKSTLEELSRSCTTR